MLCGFPPFYEEEPPALFDQILNARYDFPSPWWDPISQDAKTLVRKMLTVDPKKRITASEAKTNTWILNASGTVIDTGTLRKYQASIRLKKATKKLMAMNKMKNLAAAAAGS